MRRVAPVCLSEDMSIKRPWIISLVAIVGMTLCAARSEAFLDDATILIDRALNSPVITVRYSGASAASVELLINGSSFGRRNVNAGQSTGETNFTIDLSALKDGDNSIEVRLVGKDGKILGVEKTIISTDDSAKGPVYLVGPKMGATVQGPVEIKLGFGKQLKNVYVSFFIDNQFKMMSNFPPYSYLWDTSRETNGWHEVEAWVVDDTSDTYKTRKVKVFVNNPGGQTKRRLPAKPTTPEKTPEKPVIPLRPAVNPVMAAPSGESNLKPVKYEPGWSGGTKPEAATPSAPMLQPMANGLAPQPSGAGDTKPSLAPSSTPTGPKYMTPSGARLALEPSKPSKPNTDLPVLPKPVADLPGPERSDSRPSPTVPTLTVTPSTPKPIATTKPVATPVLPPKPVKPEPVKPAPVKTLPVVPGATLPGRGVYVILLNSVPVRFEDVQPRIEEGIPLTPFRHLFEQAGGEVKWAHDTKSIDALGDGNALNLTIGNKQAFINRQPFDLDRAPFIERGRTVVPLSFVKSALKVSIDFDPKSGHVLITRDDKKKGD